MGYAKICKHWVDHPRGMGIADFEVIAPDYCEHCAPQVQVLKTTNPTGEISHVSCEHCSGFAYYLVGTLPLPRFCAQCQARWCNQCDTVQDERGSHDRINPVARICELCLHKNLRAELALKSHHHPVELLGKTIYQTIYEYDEYDWSDDLVGVPRERWVVIAKNGMALLVARFTLGNFGLFSLGASKKDAQKWAQNLSNDASKRLSDALIQWQAETEHAKATAHYVLDQHNRKYHPEQFEAEAEKAETVRA
ncbi:MAG TPA: hypothetical protein VKT25_14205 [Ktedonobacteraceae bacterium]|nr:hypothetical protein [Ktedonobacteraceae bacterium]